jgi:hypothetical protein
VQTPSGPVIAVAVVVVVVVDSEINTTSSISTYFLRLFSICRRIKYNDKSSRNRGDKAKKSYNIYRGMWKYINISNFHLLLLPFTLLKKGWFLGRCECSELPISIWRYCL